jgi:hypothetical protein
MRRFIKKFESKQNDITLSDIYEILSDIIDDGNIIIIIGDNGFTFNSKIMKHDDFSKSFFKLKKYESQKENIFSFEIEFNSQLNYEELTKFLSDFNTEIGRFKDLGYTIKSFDVQSYSDSDIYRANGIYFKMINFDN